MHHDPSDTMPPTPLDHTIGDAHPEWPSLETDEHLGDDPGL